MRVLRYRLQETYLFREIFANSSTWRLCQFYLTGVFRFVEQGMGTVHMQIAVARLSLLFFPSLPRPRPPSSLTCSLLPSHACGATIDVPFESNGINCERTKHSQVANRQVEAQCLNCRLPPRDCMACQAWNDVCSYGESSPRIRNAPFDSLQESSLVSFQSTLSKCALKVFSRPLRHRSRSIYRGIANKRAGEEAWKKRECDQWRDKISTESNNTTLIDFSLR